MDRNGQKWTKTDRNRHKQKETYRNGKKLTEMERNRQKQTDTEVDL